MYFLRRVIECINDNDHPDGLQSTCIKLLEIVAVCCSSKGKTNDNSQRQKSINTKDFLIDDLPEVHPIMTREAIESIAEHAFRTICGLVSMGGQVKIDDHILSDVLQGGEDALPSSAVLNIRNYKKTSIKFRTDKCDHSAYSYTKPNFGDVYHPFKEEIPDDIPTPKESLFR